MKRILLTLSAMTLAWQGNNVLAQTALNFNGTNNTVTTTIVPIINNQSRTVDAWIKTNSSSTSQMVICDWGAVTPLGGRFTLNILNNKLRIEVGGAGVNGTSTITTGQWVHVTAVYNSTISSGSNVFVYVNGTLEGSGNFTGYSTLTTTTTVPFRLGARVDGINFFPGAIDEVKVYNYARSASEVAADTVEACLPQAGLVAYYKLNEGIPNGTNTGSTTAIDYAASNNGTLNSFTLTGTTSNWVTGRVRSGAPAITANPGTNICSGSTASLSINTPNSFTWSTNSTASLITVSPTTNTVYSVVSTNSANCSYTSFVSVVVTTAVPSVTVNTLQNPICHGASTSFSASGGVTYTWSGGINNGQLFTPTATTVYSLTAGNACGNVNSTYTITVTPVNVTVSATPAVICTGRNGTLSALSSVNGYTWSPGPLTGQNVVISPTANTIYTVTASDGTCVGTNTLQVNTNPSPTITLNYASVTLCSGQQVSLVADGAGSNGTYTWEPGTSTGASLTTTPPSTNAYTVSGTNSLGCTSSVQIPVIVMQNPTVTASASQTLVCNGQTVTLNAGGAGTYTWNFGATASSTVMTPVSPSTIYTVTGTSASNSCTASQTVEVAVITPSVTYSSSLSVCAGKNATLSASGATSYTWNVFSMPSGQWVVTPAATTQYTLIANTQVLNVSCLTTHFATVSVNANPTVTAVKTLTNFICKGNTNTLTANGATSYTWMPGNLNTAQVVVTPSVSTNYTVIGENAQGCTGTTKLQVNVQGCNGVEELDNSNQFAVYPNPASGTLFIKSFSEFDLHLISMSGQLVKVVHVTSGEVKVDVSEIPAGIYILKGGETNAGLTRKIVIE